MNYNVLLEERMFFAKKCYLPENALVFSSLFNEGNDMYSLM